MAVTKLGMYDKVLFCLCQFEDYKQRKNGRRAKKACENIIKPEKYTKIQWKKFVKGENECQKLKK